MARNEEKNYTILNRLYLEQQEKVTKEKNPERPNLNTLHTAAQVKKWIPGIKWEINFCLHHLSGIRNYPDYKIREFEERLENLKKEYKRWVKRTYELDPDTIGIPGDPHIYFSKKTMSEIKEKKQVAQQGNPNGYTKLYYNIFRMPHAEEPQIEYDENGYPKEGGRDYFTEAGGIEGLDVIAGADPDAIVTPLAERHDGFKSDEEKVEASKEQVTSDPDDPQNRPLSFSSKKRTNPEITAPYVSKRAHTTPAPPAPPKAAPSTSPAPVALGLLAGYDSDE